MFSIRKAGIGDTLLLTEIGSRSFIESHGHSAPAKDIEGYVSTKFTISALEEELKDAANIFHIIYYNGGAAGYSKIILNTPYPVIANKNITKLERIYLLKEFHDKKLGKALFEFNKQFSINAGQEGIWLYVWVANERAVRFYEKAGFEVVAAADFKISDTHSNPNHIMYLKY